MATQTPSDMNYRFSPENPKVIGHPGVLQDTGRRDDDGKPILEAEVLQSVLCRVNGSVYGMHYGTLAWFTGSHLEQAVEKQWLIPIQDVDLTNPEDLPAAVADKIAEIERIVEEREELEADGLEPVNTDVPLNQDKPKKAPRKKKAAAKKTPRKVAADDEQRPPS